ncbi:MAG TPA: MlaD family protein [Baekduia sp.]|nr:MlaD family protein [Baekduia sp.]
MIDVRGRRAERLNRARVELELRRGLRPALVVLAFLALGLGIALYILTRVSPNALSGTTEVSFAVGDVTAIQPGINEVRFKGVPAGTIEQVEVRGDQPVLRVALRKEFGRIYRDARAQLRPNTALQDMYLDIVDRGRPAAGVADADEPLAEDRTDLPVSVSDVLNVFGAQERTRLATLLDELGNGMADRGRSLRQIFVTTTPFVQAAGRIARQLAGRRGQVRRLVHNTRLLTRELGVRERQLRTLLREGGATMQTLQHGSGDLGATLAELPPALAAIDTAFAATRGVLDDADGALRAAGPVAGRLPASLDALRRLSADLAPAVAALRRPVSDLLPLARILRPLSGDLEGAVRALAPEIDTVDKVTRDLAGCKTGVQGFFQWNASMAKFGDARGPIPRGNVVFGAQSSSLLNDPREYAPQACTPGRVIGGRVPTAKDKH